jgi:hypothetical protein
MEIGRSLRARPPTSCVTMQLSTYEDGLASGIDQRVVTCVSAVNSLYRAVPSLCHATWPCLPAGRPPALRPGTGLRRPGLGPWTPAAPGCRLPAASSPTRTGGPTVMVGRLG